jgi:hypothetical protein
MLITHTSVSMTSCLLIILSINFLLSGRCTLCEPSWSKIAHPPSGNHAGAKRSDIGASVSSADCITDSDFMYFDCLRDVKFAEIINAKPSSEMKQPTIP